MHDDRHERQRVAANIGAVVLAFCKERLEAKRADFHMHELTAYVQARHASAPASADRILRLLREARLVDYEVKDRSRSLYRLLRAAEVPSAPPAPRRPDVGGGPSGLFGDEAPAKGRGLDAIRGR